MTLNLTKNGNGKENGIRKGGNMGAFKFVSHKAEIIDAKNRAVEAALNEIGLTAERFIKEKISEPKPHKNGDTRPSVVTGELRRSIDYNVDTADESVTVGTNVEYAPYVELGTVRAPAYPYIRPAIEEHMGEFKEITQKHLQGG